MVAAIDWCPHITHGWIWIVSYFGFNGPLRQYFSLYRAVSQRGRKKRKVKEGKKGEKRHIVLSLLTEDIVKLMYEHRCKVLTI